MQPHIKISLSRFRIDKETGLPPAPEGFRWYLRVDDTAHFPYVIRLLPEGKGTRYNRAEYAENRFEIVYTTRSFLRAATRETVRPGQVRRAARRLLKGYAKYLRRKACRPSTGPTVEPGFYPPNKL